MDASSGNVTNMDTMEWALENWLFKNDVSLKGVELCQQEMSFDFTLVFVRLRDIISTNI